MEDNVKTTVSDLLEDMINIVVTKEQTQSDSPKYVIHYIIDEILTTVTKSSTESHAKQSTASDILIDSCYGGGDETELDVGRGRKRKRERNPAKWKRNEQKKKRYSGEEHFGPSGKHHAEKRVGQLCGENCKLSCPQKFSLEARKEILNSYWGLGDRVEQRHFLTRHVEKCDKKRSRVGSPKKKRESNFKYYFYSEDDKVNVCRSYFLQTLDITKDSVYRLMAGYKRGQVTIAKSGGHGLNKYSEASIEHVKNHIRSFPIVDSHYCRATSKRKYLYPGLSVQKMYDLYLAKCKQDGIEPVTRDKYRKIFNYEFNLGFFRPKKDQCERCIAYRNTRNPTQEDIRNHKEHLMNKERAREVKNSCKEKCQHQKNAPQPKTAAAAFDMEQILNCPHGSSSEFYYKRRLGIYNLTVFDYKEKDVSCFMWPEYEGGRGSTAVGTCLFKYLKNKKTKEPHISEIDLFSDNTCAQNKNRYVAFSLWYACKHIKYERITHTFLEVGHTETENDNVHSMIEQRTRNITINTPEQWYSAVRLAGSKKNPYTVFELSKTDFIDWKTM